MTDENRSRFAPTIVIVGVAGATAPPPGTRSANRTEYGVRNTVGEAALSPFGAGGLR